MKTVPLVVLAGLAVAGCSAQDTRTGDSYQSYLRNHAAGTQAAPMTGGVDDATGLGAPDEPVSTGSIGADTLAVLRQTAPGAGVSNFVDDGPAVLGPVPTAPVHGGSISSAGSVAMPGMTGTGATASTGASGGPNLAAYALSVDHAPGQAVYPRGGFHLTSTERACAKFPSSDRAQMAFLEKGGPRADKLNLDPDGDGFACGWDPRPFQLARQ